MRYLLTDEFRGYLDEVRPGIANVLCKYGVTDARLEQPTPGGRCLLFFPGVPADKDPCFDRQVHTDACACVVLDEHPEAVLAVRRLIVELGLRPVRLGEYASAGKTPREVFLPAARVKRAGVAHTSPLVKVTVFRRESYLLHCRLDGGQEFTLDVDELDTFPGAWVAS